MTCLHACGEPQVAWTLVHGCAAFSTMCALFGLRRVLKSRYFSDTMEAMIAEAKSEGRHERGPINLQATAVHIAKQTVIHREAGTGGALHPCLYANCPGNACTKARDGMCFPSTASVPLQEHVCHRHTMERVGGGASQTRLS